ncbi:hypothetical protein [Streptomyces sp. NRRL S-646]|uniref:hypothetical protein n=1 Tax=Streptomyces sp. NRRL S-646 TaxID=1463917 RepID=UPI000AA7D083|nr:hypothetical protein [Streptomyces sp. NRRL S-646]
MTQNTTLHPPATPGTLHRTSPPHSTDTKAVLTSLGLTPTEPTTLHEEGAV